MQEFKLHQYSLRIFPQSHCTYVAPHVCHFTSRCSYTFPPLVAHEIKRSLFATLLPLFATLLPLFAPLLPLFAPLLPLFAPLLPLFAPLLPLFATLLPLFATLLPLFATLLPLFATLLPLRRGLFWFSWRLCLFRYFSSCPLLPSVSECSAEPPQQNVLGGPQSSS